MSERLASNIEYWIIVPAWIVLSMVRIVKIPLGSLEETPWLGGRARSRRTGRTGRTGRTLHCWTWWVSRYRKYFQWVWAYYQPTHLQLSYWQSEDIVLTETVWWALPRLSPDYNSAWQAWDLLFLLSLCLNGWGITGLSFNSWHICSINALQNNLDGLLILFNCCKIYIWKILPRYLN